MDCLQCGDCCKTLKSVKITKEEYEILLSHGTPEVTERDDGRMNMVLPCIFQANNNCSIHNDRPTMCRMWHCGKINPADKMIDWVSEIQKLMEDNPEYKKFKFQMEDEAVQWGNKHGWNLHR